MSQLQGTIIPRFTAYVRGMEDSRVRFEAGPENIEDRVFSYPLQTVHKLNDGTSYSFSGTVRSLGHSGMLNLPISDPEVVIQDGWCALRIPDPDDGTCLVFASGHAEEADGVVAAALALEEAGSELFFYRYPTGWPLEPLRFRVEAEGTVK